ncbi:MAG TPA: Gldg family protein [Phycisphaerae bacterium]|nr:Gldg family protein [Phycisphaerae bacterium]
MTQSDTQSSQTPETGKRSYWLYGSNVAILVIIAVVIITMLMALTAPIRKKWDLTGNGAYSLSGYTQQLLKDVDEKKQKFELINAFPLTESRQQQVQDILDEYARASNNIAVADLSQVNRDQIVQKIKDRYTSELHPYEDAVADYRKVSADVAKFAKAEAANMGAVAQQPGATEQTQKDAAQMQGLFSDLVPAVLSDTRRDVNRYTDTTTPDYGQAVDSIKKNFGQIVKQLTLLSDQKQVGEILSPPVAKLLADEEKQYAAMLAELKDYLAKLDKLPPSKVQDVLNNLGPDTIVVLGPSSASVVSESSIYKAPTDESSQATPAFQGEQAVSSALLPMIEPNKVKVVFVSSTSNLHPSTSTNEEGWSDIADRLRSVNFDVMEWAPPGPPTGPDQPPQSPTPPAEGKGVVWIVFPPDPANPQMMMMGMPPPSPQPVIDAVKKHLDEGGQVLFLADAASNDMFSQGTGYAYADLLKPFGIDVESKYTVVHNYPDQNGERRVFPQILVSRYGDHPITKPLQALQTAFVGFGSRNMPGFFGAPTYVGVDKQIPAGVDAQVLLESPNDSDTWAEATYNQTAAFNKGTDLAAPIPLAAAAVKNNGKPDEQRVVVIACRTIGANTLIEAINARENDRGGAELFMVNPGNAELLTNSVLWLGGYKNMIAVSAKSAAAARIRSIPEGMMLFIHVMLYLGIPLLALVLGGVVYFFRRR